MASRLRVVVATVFCAAGSLTCGETAGPDPNAVASVIITPAGGSVDTGDSLQLSAVAYNAAGNELSGTSFAWSSLDAALATVSSGGRVRAHWPGVARIVATSDQKSDTARLTIQPKITSLAVTPLLDTLTALGTTVTVRVRASIGGQDYTGGSYSWELTDTSVASFQFSGEPDSLRTVRAVKNGATFVRVREARGAVDSARIVVRQRPKAIYFNSSPRAYRACPFRVTAVVADSFGNFIQGVQFTWSSTDTTRARIDSTGLVTPIAPGVDTIVVRLGTLSQRAALTIGVAPSVTLQISGVASRVTTVGRGQFASAFGFPAGVYTDAPARFSIVSSDTTILAVPSDTSLPLGGQPQFGPLHLVGRSLGTVTLTPYLCDVPGASVGFTVTPPVLAVYGDLLTAARIDDPPAMLGVLTRDTTGALQATAEPVTVRLTSTDTNVVRPDSLYHHIPAGNFRADFRFTFPDSGSARLVVHDSAGLYPPDSTAVIHVSYPPIYFSDGDTLRVGMRQRVYPPNQHANVGVDRLVGGTPLTIHLSTSDSTLARLTPDSVSIPVGGSGAPIDIAGGDRRGTATLTAHAARHLDGHLVVRVDRPKVFMGYGNFQLYPGDSMDIQVSVWDSATFYPGYPTENVTFDLSTTDTSVVTTDATVTVPAGSMTSIAARVRAKGLGAATVTATDPRAVPYAYATDGAIPITVIEPYLAISPSGNSLGIRHNRDLVVTANGPYRPSYVVHVRQSNAALISLADSTIIVPAFSGGSVVATGTASGVDTVVVSAAGFRPDTTIITVGIPTATIPQWPNSMSVGDSMQLLLETAAPDGTGQTTADTVVFTLAPNANIEFHLDGAVISTLTVPAGSYYAPFFWVKAKAAGTGTVTVTAPNHTPLTQSVTISP